MAKTRKYKFGAPVQLAVAVTDPTTPAAGDPVRFGTMAGVALTAKDSVTGLTTVDFGESVHTLQVFDELTGGVLAGQAIYYDDTAAGSPTTKLTNQVTGAEAFLGIAITTLGNGATGAVDVLVGRRALS